MIRKSIFYLLLFALAGGVFSSCRKGGTSWDTDISAPIFKTSFGINNLLPDSLLSKNPDSSLTLVYKGDLYNLSLDSFIHIHDTTVKNVYSLPFTTYTFHCGDLITPAAPGNITQTTYPLHGVGLKTSRLLSGKMSVDIVNKVRKKIQLNYQIPSATLAGVPFSINVWVDGRSGSTSGHYTSQYDLSGYTIDLSGQTNNSINTVVTSITAYIDPSLPTSDTVNVTASDDLEINSTFKQMVPSYAKGYFGQTMQNAGPAENSFPIFSRFISGSLNLQSVSLSFHIENGIGADARVLIPQIYSKNNHTGHLVQLSAPIINSPINLNRALETFTSPPVIPSSYNITLNNTNSNIKAFIENLPDKIGYQLSLQPNPLGNVSGYNDFIHYGYGIRAGLDLQIPLSLVANNLTLADTLAVNFDKVASNIQRLHSCTLTLFSENGFPFTTGVQLYMLDQNNMVTDYLITGNNVIDAAPLDGNLKAIGQRQTILEIPVASDKINKLIHSKKIVIVSKFNTSSNPNYVKIYDDYRIDFRLSGDFNYTVKLQ